MVKRLGSEKMNVLDTSFKRSSFEIEIKHSILFECALGIAMFTYPKLHEQLEKTKVELEDLRKSISKELQSELDYCQQHNTWKMILQLLHQRDFYCLQDFLDHLDGLDQKQFTYLVFPYLDESQQTNRILASEGDNRAVKEMAAACVNHAFFSQMISFIAETETSELIAHIKSLMKGWFQEVTKNKNVEQIFQRDVSEKKQLLAQSSPEKVVQWATGTVYKPEVNVDRVLLIPHTIYRPWTIEANLEQTKVFYYPVSDDSLYGIPDSCQPPGYLVQAFKALADEKRLRILNLLSDSNRSLKELTEILDIGKTTIHHHLAILKSAHMVSVTGTMYSLNKSALGGYEASLLDYLNVEVAREK